jgi:CBS domain-containing protein
MSGPEGGAEMTVRKIIEAKAKQAIISVKPEDDVSAAAASLAKNRIGAVIVTGDGATVDGILSERDIVRALGTSGPGCLSMKVRELMTSSVIGCKMDDTADSVMERMSDGRFRHMPVIDENRLVGVISIGDVVKARIEEIQHDNEALTGMIANTW